LIGFLGIINLNPEKLLSQIPSKLQIRNLKLNLNQVLKRFTFNSYVNEACNIMLEEDALLLLRQQNQGQRKAIKVFMFFIAASYELY
jgi:hypothetical protein